MSDTMDRLQSLATDVMAAVPADVMSGSADAVLYGIGFLGRWAVEALPATGIRLSACYDGNPALAGEVIGGVPVRAASSIEADDPGFVFITARHAVRSVAERLGAAGIAVVAMTGARLSGSDSGLLAGMVIGTSFEWLRAATQSRVDMTLTFFVMVTILAWHRVMWGQGGRWMRLLGFASVTAAILTKGPVGLLLPLIVSMADAANRSSSDVCIQWSYSRCAIT